MSRNSLALSLSFALAPYATAGGGIGTVRFATGLSDPVYVVSPPGDHARLFVCENTGDIEILDLATGAQRPAPFLELALGDRLHGLAFHPAYAENGWCYIWFEDAVGVSRLVRYTRSISDPDRAESTSAQPVLEITTNFGHAGGWLGFGPDGCLYLLVGDGGDTDSHDAAGRGQSITGELLANVLRLDINGDAFPGDATRNYAIPPTNPFVGIAGEDEIWSYGLRNPWRASFDRATGDFILGDVGQDSREEIDFERAGTTGGRNYGWRPREGKIATPTGGVGGAQPPGGVDPVHDYAHGAGAFEGQSITGGYVYRGPVAALQGHYFFGDFLRGRIWSVRVDRDTGTASDLTEWTMVFAPTSSPINQVVSFGEDAAGNLYVVDFDGDIFRVVGPPSVPAFGNYALACLAGAFGVAGAVALRRRRGELTATEG